MAALCVFRLIDRCIDPVRPQFTDCCTWRLPRCRSPAAAAAAPEGAAVTTESPAAGKTLREVTKDDFYEAIKSHGDRLTVVDCYTEW